MKKVEFMNWSRDFNALLKVKSESMLLIFFEATTSHNSYLYC